jgi:hypothetical protein
MPRKRREYREEDVPPGHPRFPLYPGPCEEEEAVEAHEEDTALLESGEARITRKERRT